MRAVHSCRSDYPAKHRVLQIFRDARRPSLALVLGIRSSCGGCDRREACSDVKVAAVSSARQTAARRGDLFQEAREEQEAPRERQRGVPVAGGDCETGTGCMFEHEEGGKRAAAHCLKI
jgi:hypothetical protein